MLFRSVYKEAIDTADAKYNGSVVVKVKASKAKASPTMEGIKAKVKASSKVAETA